MATSTDPEADSKRIYDVKGLDPFFTDSKLYSLDYYQKDGYSYLILSSFIYNLRRVDNEENEMIDAFYKSLDKNSELIIEFKPYKVDIEPLFFFEQMWGPITNMSKFERPGPVIKIYQVTTN